MLSLSSFVRLVSVGLVAQSAVVAAQGWGYWCKCYPGDFCWPPKNSLRWWLLNQAVDGNLREVVPDPAVCYNTFRGKPTYNAQACQEVRDNWTNEQWQTDREVSNIWIHWTNTTCLPTENPNDSCTLGYVPEYVIMAQNRQHVKAGVDFARMNNLRLIIRNTGHDFMGRSTGYGALAINTHNLKQVTFHDRWNGPGGYTGSAVTVGAGVQGRELWYQLNARNPPLAVVTGECPTVGFAGGFIQGGGHGPLSTIHGMAADQALQFEVVTADGRYLTVNSRNHPDLFWALKGGGPSTFAAVISVTVKTFPEVPSAGATLYINWTHTVDQELFWKGFSAFHNRANYWVDHGMYAYYELFPFTFRVQPFVAPNMNASQLATVLQPLYDELDAQGVPYESSIKDYSTFFDLYIDLFEDEQSGANVLIGGRIFTRQDIEEHGNDIVEAKKGIVNYGVIGHIVGPGHGLPSADSAVNPVWRNATSMSITMYPMTPDMSFDQKAAAEQFLTDHVDGPLRAASPYGAAYVNEGNLAEPNWQTAFWGTNYPRLLDIKRRYDPFGVFYARSTPGTEDWEVLDYGRRLCKKVF
ncbi:FAD binding domain-containing protein [Coprinopsis cinerea okayama7|uniref:FAD binding domain-containing protein n=1 Tax=Coprinopsis cinerea (strain Okayama-7 / 130 / ATCC MYA-4618 / FGSC 9003) TaxID=240176 RepID=A8P5L0_COPC7|nr:FAD binding domain-containing protein [Coprinopsis cinerea okayama7\|eukprot:XP_001838967.1 FAD binding domain-containing protein [Coprinopsis cinerea okayama7\